MVKVKKCAAEPQETAVSDKKKKLSVLEEKTRIGLLQRGGRQMFQPGRHHRWVDTDQEGQNRPRRIHQDKPHSDSELAPAAETKMETQKRVPSVPEKG